MKLSSIQPYDRIIGTVEHMDELVDTLKQYGAESLRVHLFKYVYATMEIIGPTTTTFPKSSRILLEYKGNNEDILGAITICTQVTYITSESKIAKLLISVYDRLHKINPHFVIL